MDNRNAILFVKDINKIIGATIMVITTFCAFLHSSLLNLSLKKLNRCNSCNSI